MRPTAAALFLFVSTLAVPARAAILTWPGAAPCAGTLQACINAATAGDFILISTNVAIAENLTLSKSLTLQPGAGFAPRLAPGFGISGTSSGSEFYSVVVRRLALTDARVVLTHAGSGSAHMEVRGLTITSTNTSTPAGIRISASLSGAAGIRIAENRLRVAVPSLFDAAIEVDYQGSAGSALVDFNHVDSVGDDGDGKGRKGKRPGLSAEFELRNHFAGKRSSPRRPLDVRITICGLLENFPARSVDISRTGILFRITDDLFAHEQEDLASFAFKVQQHFADAADVLFVDHGFGASASVIRVTHRRMDEQPTLLLACRFHQPLSDGQCQTLGVSRSLRKRKGKDAETPEPVPDEQA